MNFGVGACVYPGSGAKLLRMDYFVIGPDGQEYGPASIDTLRQWVSENRVLPTTMLKSVQSGLTVAASTIGELFPPMRVAAPQSAPPGNWSQPPSDYPRNAGYVPQSMDDGKADLMWAIGRSVAALIFFFVLQGIGLFFAIYAVIYAFRAKEKGHRFGNLAVAISVVTLVIIGIGWALRLSGASPRMN